MAKAAPTLKISLNLLYPQGLPSKLPAKLLKWALTFGRYIGIVVEIVVLVAFAARFKLDADLADTNDKINSQIPHIESLKKDEQTIRNTQFKLLAVKQNLSKIPNWQGTLSKISSQMPSGAILSNLSFNNSSDLTFKLTGEASSNNDLAIFLSGLKGEEGFKDINLTSINFDDEGLSFTISGALK